MRKTSTKPVVRLFYSENLTHGQIEELRVDIKRAFDNPDYTIITSYPVQWVDVGPGDVLCASDAGVGQATNLRLEMDAAYEDSNHIPVANCTVVNAGNPRDGVR